uniref:Uncharacterized protein n=1 Tax=viral metagenome TaxID=1070528 RepID=A0A6M3LF08_9ZZZZ
MTTTIGSVTLDHDMIFADEYEYTQVNASVEDTIGGGIYVQEFQRSESGRPITLESTETQGLQLKSTVDSIRALADIANATYALSIVSNNQSVSKTVRFRQELDRGPVEFQPFHPRDGLHSDTIYYKGRIHLMVI